MRPVSSCVTQRSIACCVLMIFIAAVPCCRTVLVRPGTNVVGTTSAYYGRFASVTQLAVSLRDGTIYISHNDGVASIATNMTVKDDVLNGAAKKCGGVAVFSPSDPREEELLYALCENFGGFSKFYFGKISSLNAGNLPSIMDNSIPGLTEFQNIAVRGATSFLLCVLVPQPKLMYCEQIKGRNEVSCEVVHDSIGSCQTVAFSPSRWTNSEALWGTVKILSNYVLVRKVNATADVDDRTTRIAEGYMIPFGESSSALTRRFVGVIAGALHLWKPCFGKFCCSPTPDCQESEIAGTAGGAADHNGTAADASFEGVVSLALDEVSGILYFVQRRGTQYAVRYFCCFDYFMPSPYPPLAQLQPHGYSREFYSASTEIVLALSVSPSFKFPHYIYLLCARKSPMPKGTFIRRIGPDGAGQVGGTLGLAVMSFAVNYAETFAVVGTKTNIYCMSLENSSTESAFYPDVLEVSSIQWYQKQPNPSTNLFVFSDTKHSCLRQVELVGDACGPYSELNVIDFAGKFNDSSIRDGSLTEARFTSPTHIAMLHNRSVMYIADTWVIRKIFDSTVSTINSTIVFSQISGMVVDLVDPEALFLVDKSAQSIVAFPSDDVSNWTVASGVFRMGEGIEYGYLFNQSLFSMPTSLAITPKSGEVLSVDDNSVVRASCCLSTQIPHRVSSQKRIFPSITFPSTMEGKLVSLLFCSKHRVLIAMFADRIMTLSVDTGQYAHVQTKLYGPGQSGGLALNADQTVLFATVPNKHVLSKYDVYNDGSIGEGELFRGSFGEPGNTGSPARFNTPMGIVCNGSTVLVADSENNFIRSTSFNGKLHVFAGSGAAGASQGSLNNAQIYRPVALALSSTTWELYVASGCALCDALIYRISDNYVHIIPVAKRPIYEIFSMMAYPPDANILLIVESSCDIIAYDLETQDVELFAGQRFGCNTTGHTDTYALSQTLLSQPKQIAYDGNSGTLFVVENATSVARICCLHHQTAHKDYISVNSLPIIVPAEAGLGKIDFSPVGYRLYGSSSDFVSSVAISDLDSVSLSSWGSINHGSSNAVVSNSSTDDALTLYVAQDQCVRKLPSDERIAGPCPSVPTAADCKVLSTRISPKKLSALAINGSDLFIADAECFCVIVRDLATRQFAEFAGACGDDGASSGLVSVASNTNGFVSMDRLSLRFKDIMAISIHSIGDGALYTLSSSTLVAIHKSDDGNVLLINASLKFTDMAFHPSDSDLMYLCAYDLAVLWRFGIGLKQLTLIGGKFDSSELTDGPSTLARFLGANSMAASTTHLFLMDKNYIRAINLNLAPVNNYDYENGSAVIQNYADNVTFPAFILRIPYLNYFVVAYCADLDPNPPYTYTVAFLANGEILGSKSFDNPLFYRPTSAIFSRNTHSILFVAFRDGNCVQTWNITSGSMANLVGVCDGEPTILNRPGSIADKGWKTEHILLIPSTNHYCVVGYNTSSAQRVRTIGQCGVSGFLDGAENIAKFLQPTAVTLGRFFDDIYIADAPVGIRKHNAGVVTTILPTTVLSFISFASMTSFFRPDVLMMCDTCVYKTCFVYGGSNIEINNTLRRIVHAEGASTSSGTAAGGGSFGTVAGVSFNPERGELVAISNSTGVFSACCFDDLKVDYEENIGSGMPQHTVTTYEYSPEDGAALFAYNRFYNQILCAIGVNIYQISFFADGSPEWMFLINVGRYRQPLGIAVTLDGGIFFSLSNPNEFCSYSSEVFLRYRGQNFRPTILITNATEIFIANAFQQTEHGIYLHRSIDNITEKIVGSLKGFEDGDVSVAKFDTITAMCLSNDGKIVYIADGATRLRKLEKGIVSTLTFVGPVRPHSIFPIPEFHQFRGFLFYANARQLSPYFIDEGRFSTYAGTFASGSADGYVWEARFATMSTAVPFLESGMMRILMWDNDKLRSLCCVDFIVPFVDTTRDVQTRATRTAAKSQPQLAFEPVVRLFAAPVGSSQLWFIDPVENRDWHVSFSLQNTDVPEIPEFVGIAFSSSTNVFLSAQNIHQIFALNLSTRIASSKWGSQKGSADDPVRFYSPSHLQWDGSTEKLLVADKENNCVRKLDINGINGPSIAGLCGSGGFVDGSVASAQLKQPYSLALSRDSLTLYIASHYDVRRLQDEIIVTLVSRLAREVVIGEIESVTVHPIDSSIVYIADSSAGQVYLYSTKNETLHALAGKRRSLATTTTTTTTTTTEDGLPPDGSGNLTTTTTADGNFISVEDANISGVFALAFDSFDGQLWFALESSANFVVSSICCNDAKVPPQNRSYVTMSVANTIVGRQAVGYAEWHHRLIHAAAMGSTSTYNISFEADDGTVNPTTAKLPLLTDSFAYDEERAIYFFTESGELKLYTQRAMALETQPFKAMKWDARGIAFLEASLTVVVADTDNGVVWCVNTTDLQNIETWIEAGVQGAEPGDIDGPASLAIFDHPRHVAAVENPDTLARTTYVAGMSSPRLRRIKDGIVTSLYFTETLSSILLLEQNTLDNNDRLLYVFGNSLAISEGDSVYDIMDYGGVKLSLSLVSPLFVARNPYNGSVFLCDGAVMIAVCCDRTLRGTESPFYDIDASMRVSSQTVYKPSTSVLVEIGDVRFIISAPRNREYYLAQRRTLEFSSFNGQLSFHSWISGRFPEFTHAKLIRNGHSLVAFFMSAHCVLHISTSNVSNVVIIGDCTSPGLANGVFSRSKFSTPISATDFQGKMLVSDYGNNCFRSISEHGEVSDNGFYSCTSMPSGESDGEASTATMAYPSACAGTMERLFFLQGDGISYIYKLRVFEKSFVTTALVLRTISVDSPFLVSHEGADLMFHPDDSSLLFLTDPASSRILLMNWETGEAFGVLGFFEEMAHTDGFASKAKFTSPTSLSYDPLRTRVAVTDDGIIRTLCCFNASYVFSSTLIPPESTATSTLIPPEPTATVSLSMSRSMSQSTCGINRRPPPLFTLSPTTVAATDLASDALKFTCQIPLNCGFVLHKIIDVEVSGPVTSSIVSSNETQFVLVMHLVEGTPVDEDLQITVTLRKGHFGPCPPSADVQAFINVNQVPSILPVTMQKALHVTTVIAGTSSGFVSAPSLALQVARTSAMLSLATCEFSHTAPLDSYESPTRLKLGTGPGLYYRGAILGNTLIIIGGWSLIHGLLVGVVFFAGRKRTLREVCANLHWPGMTIIPYAVMGPPTAMSSMALIVHGVSVGDLVLGILALLIFCVAPICILYKLTTDWFDCRFASDEEVRREQESLGQSTSRFEYFWNGLAKWKDKGRKYKRFYGMIFADYSKGLAWYVTVDLAFSVIVSLIEGTRPGTRAGCTLAASIAALGNALTLVCVLWLRPYLVQFNLFHAIAQAVVIMICSVLVVIAQLTEDETVADLSEIFAAISIFLAAVKAIADIVLAVLKMRFSMLLSKLRSMRKASSPDAPLLAPLGTPPETQAAEWEEEEEMEQRAVLPQPEAFDFDNELDIPPERKIPYRVDEAQRLYTEIHRGLQGDPRTRGSHQFFGFGDVDFEELLAISEQPQNTDENVDEAELDMLLGVGTVQQPSRGPTRPPIDDSAFDLL